jgi:hypothetical protein
MHYYNNAEFPKGNSAIFFSKKIIVYCRIA